MLQAAAGCACRPWRLVQVPFFDRFQAKSAVEFAVRKLSPVTTAQARVVVVAFNVAGLNGIADGWRRNGLGPSSPVVCGPPRNCTFPAPCATIWIELADCSIFALSSVRIVRESSEFSTTVASLVLEAQVVSLSEGTVTFRMHLPVTDTVVWSYQSMDGALIVAAVADAGRSNLTVSQGGGRSASADGARFESTNGAPPLLVESLPAMSTASGWRAPVRRSRSSCRSMASRVRHRRSSPCTTRTHSGTGQ